MFQNSYFKSDPNLDEFIFSYGIIEYNNPKGTTLITPPNGLTGFLIRISDETASLKASISEGKYFAWQPNYAIEQSTLPITWSPQGYLKYLVVFFQPTGMYQLFGKNMKNLTDTTIDLHDFLGYEIFENLKEKLAKQSEIIKKCEVLNDFFLALKLKLFSINLIDEALKLINKSDGNINVLEIEEQLNVSRKTLERQFQEKIGLSPKVYCQIYRFKLLMNYLNEHPNTTWTELSNKYKFFDQAHMIRYFKKYLNVSPNNIVMLDLPAINYLLLY